MFKKLFQTPTRRVAVTLIILNEVRGVAVVAAVVDAWLKARGH